jgi:hypothetical protein
MHRPFKPQNTGQYSTVAAHHLKCKVKNAEYRVSPFFTLHSSFFISLPGRLISRTPPFEGGHVGASPAPAANFDKSSFDRSVVK